MMVTQNNELGTLSVIGMNKNLQELLGYESEIDDAPFSQFLGSSAEKLVKEDVEYLDDAKDLLEVLRSHRQMRLLKQNGVEINLDVKIMRSMARDRHHLFRLVFSTPSLVKEKKSLSNMLRESFTGYEVTDSETMLPDRASMLKYIELTESYVKSKPIGACFVYMRVENYEEEKKINKKHDVNVLQHLSHVVKRNLREDDTVGRISDDALGIILVDINDETVHLALNRIKHMIHHDPLILQNKEAHIPLIRQSCVFLGDISTNDVAGFCVDLLDEDEQRDMVVYRENSDKTKVFG